MPRLDPQIDMELVHRPASMSAHSTNAVSAEMLQYMFHHVFLPPKLPNGDDSSALNDSCLIQYVHETLDEFLQVADGKHHIAIKTAMSMIANTLRGRDESGFLRESDVQDILKEIGSHRTSASFHIMAQNAGIILRCDEESAIFELFELSPTNAAVYGTQGRLIRHFPAVAIGVPLDTYAETSFQEVLVKTLVKMSYEEFEESIPKTRKAKQDHDEERESNDPQIVTELLCCFLRGVGRPVSVFGIRKNTREEIMWNQSKLPWRRSPVWLLIRSSLQLTMDRMVTNSEELYKSFMIFFLSRVLTAATALNTKSETLKIMLTKLSRRRLKLQYPIVGGWMKTVHESVSAASRILGKRIQDILNGAEKDIDLKALTTLNMADDVYIDLPGLHEFVSSISKRKNASNLSTFCPTSDITTFKGTFPAIPSDISDHSRPFLLAMVESWVATQLDTEQDSWLRNHIRDMTTCLNLCSLMQKYHEEAISWYKNRPEGVSRMLLVILELWVAADKAAICAIPLLKDYEHEIPAEVFQALLLGFKGDMRRLHCAETYLKDRQDRARRMNKPSIFVSYGQEGSFPIEYFSTSPLHQTLLHEIGLWADRERQSKCEEFRSRQADYRDLMNRYGQGVCEQSKDYDEYGRLISRHSRYCSRCGLRDAAMNMSVEVHEWPLSNNPLEAQATVFELDLPNAFGAWRDATLYIIDDVLQSKQISDETPYSEYPLRCYAGLSNFFKSDTRLRIHLLSSEKPHIASHWSRRKVCTSSEADICVNNGLRFGYFDDKRRRFLNRFTATTRLYELCTIKLNSRSSQLKPFLVRTHETPAGEVPNMVFSKQDLCPEHLLLDEFKTLASLPFGQHIQWMTILIQLAMPSIDFNKFETAVFLLQLSLQVGPNETGKVERCSHTRLSDTEFGHQMLNNLQERVSCVGENWESNTALWTFTFLTARVLSMTSRHLQGRALDLLKECREISFQWLGKLRSRAHEAKDEDQRTSFLRIALRMSLICADSFNVDDIFLEVILSDLEQSAILLESSIHIHNNIVLLRKEQDLVENILYDRWMFTLHRARPILLREVLERGNTCLYKTVNRYWLDFRREADWHLVPSTCNWLETTSGHHKVHVNILNGELLVNGTPLSHLPSEYENSDDYRKIFGSFVLDVMPSTLQGMRFCSCKALDGYTVHFSMEDDVSQRGNKMDLMIRLHDKENGLPTLDLVPSRFFNQVIPHKFVKDFTHWYDHEKNSIEFYPINGRWKGSRSNWVLTQHDSFWKLTRLRKISLLAPKSQSAGLIAEILSPLDPLLNLHMLYDVGSGVLDINVSSLQLEFFLNSNEAVIQSRQFRGMQIDADQSMGTLLGFKSKLVMRDSHKPGIRMVIIPEGEISFHRDSSIDHVRATVDYGTAHRVQRYEIDDRLRRLVDNATVESKLFIAYIHALTSFCIPDPFLGRTGTEEALAILESASIRSVDYLTRDCAKVLRNIAALAPSRVFYPEHLHVMQRVDWSPKLSFLTQDSRFYKIVNRLVDRISGVSFLYPSGVANAVKMATPTHADLDLIELEVFRNSRYQVSHFGAEEFTSNHDREYISRDRKAASHQSDIASETAFRIYNDIETVEKHVDTGSIVDLIYEYLTHEDGTFAARNMLQPLDIEYGIKWLQDPKEFLHIDWYRLHYAFQMSKDWANKYQVMMWLTTMAYSSKCNIHILQALMMLSLSTRLSASALPDPLLYFLLEGYELQESQLQSIVSNKRKAFHDKCPEKSIPPYPDETPFATEDRRENSFLNMRKSMIDSFVGEIVRQWPCPIPNEPWQLSYQPYIDVHGAIGDVRLKWKKWYENRQLRERLEEFVHRLGGIKNGSVNVTGISCPVHQIPVTRPHGFISVDKLFSYSPPLITEVVSLDLNTLLEESATNSEASNKLNEVLSLLDTQTNSIFEQQYVAKLRRSLEDLQNCKAMKLRRDSICTRDMLFEGHLNQCRTRAEDIYNILSDAVLLSQKKEAEKIAFVAGFCPRPSPTFFLQQLGRHRWPSLTEAWKSAIITYGCAITALQQAQRLVQLKGNVVDLLRELENTGHKNWQPYQYPEWLLLECESGIIIRDVQDQIAKQMIAPQNDENAIMQLNMGEGKSSVIVPIVATTLSNGSQIVRAVVAKPQAKQMHQMLVSKLSGLLDRPIIRMPFSRAIRMDVRKATIIRNLVLQCKQEGGILMVQPEHLLSFQLMGLEYQINGDDEVACALLEVQRLFESSSRDIVDESDENFNVKFELIYTMGLQRPIEQTPHRWVVIQEVLARFSEICLKLKNSFLESIEIDDRHPERFPKIRILGTDAEEAILSTLADSICSTTGITGFPIALRPKRTRDAIYRYITHLSLTPTEIDAVESSAYWDDVTVSYILLLRGLFSGGILAFAFSQKRWRVDYGTDPNRETKTLLAVPFRAKDNPTPRSEFSHPDVVILLTCLAYYYSGLKDEELFEALDLLMRSDNADLEYDAWVMTARHLPPSYKQLKGVNIRDRAHCIESVFPRLRYSKGAIDYFLSRMVFAKELREFPHKLSTSGWDLGKQKSHPTTGFSGTNDSRFVLPLAMKQLDLPEQNHTNALVLEHLLRPENDVRLMSEGMARATLESESLLEMAAKSEPRARVILDVGAQIIDLDNLQFAKKWLGRCKDEDDVQAVVFFSDADELMVVDKADKVEPLQISPFAAQLDHCLVFLDEAHTRGTDLRLPTNYRAAVTLGANLTKDKLVQACMRMRKLGKGQSVIFCIPREIEQRIMTQRKSGGVTSRNIAVSDVICWAISETWRDLRRTLPLWLTQGARFYEQDVLWKQSTDFNGSSNERTEWAKKFLEDEAQSLDSRYRPREGFETAQLIHRAGPAMRLEFQRRAEDFGLEHFRDSSLQEEQERELSPETERERQVEPPPRVEPNEHSCHADLVHFVKFGEFPKSFTAFKPAFQVLEDTSATKHFDVHEFPSNIWATKDFSRTVRTNQSFSNGTDLFQRPVHWILTRNGADDAITHLVIISPWEVNHLLGDIERYRAVTLHLYAPRSNFTFKPLDKLTLYTVPQRKRSPILTDLMMIELNLFSGQLYLSSFEEYIGVCEKLGLAWSTPDDSITLGPDGFIPPGITGGPVVNKSGLKKSPVQFLRVLVTKIRRNCEAIEKTHMGKILDGVFLRESDFKEDD